MGCSRLLFAFACVVLCEAGTANGAQPETGRPAVWLPHEMIVNLHDLPKRYSCDELWYKFHDVLVAIGARPTMRILAYRCESALGAQAHSPSVELKFELPSEVRGAQTRRADVSVITRKVRIAPGEPASIDRGDCELLRQMKEMLLDSLPVRVLAFDLACTGPAQAPPRFGISAQAPTAIETDHRRTAFREIGRPQGRSVS